MLSRANPLLPQLEVHVVQVIWVGLIDTNLIRELNRELVSIDGEGSDQIPALDADFAVGNEVLDHDLSEVLSKCIAVEMKGVDSVEVHLHHLHSSSIRT